MNSRTVRKTARHSAGKSFLLSLLFIGVQFGHPLAHLEMRALPHLLYPTHGAFTYAKLVEHRAEQAAHDSLAHGLYSGFTGRTATDPNVRQVHSSTYNSTCTVGGCPASCVNAILRHCFEISVPLRIILLVRAPVVSMDRFAKSNSYSFMRDFSFPVPAYRLSGRPPPCPRAAWVRPDGSGL